MVEIRQSLPKQTQDLEREFGKTFPKFAEQNNEFLQQKLRTRIFLHFKETG
jgi:hypothetical protein